MRGEGEGLLLLLALIVYLIVCWLRALWAGENWAIILALFLFGLVAVGVIWSRARGWSERRWDRLWYLMAFVVALGTVRIFWWLSKRAAIGPEGASLPGDLKFGIPTIVLAMAAAVFIKWRRGRGAGSDQEAASDDSIESATSSSVASSSEPLSDPTTDTEPEAPMPTIPAPARPLRRWSARVVHCHGCAKRLVGGFECSACGWIKCPKCEACGCGRRRQRRRRR